MISFLLNDQTVTTDLGTGISLLDFIRDKAGLKGTKTGCREGDCGACTVLEGRLADSRIHYRPVVSCLTPLGNARGKHIVTIEGLRTGKLNPVQQAFVDHSATQCGFCTPGFILSLMGFLLSESPAVFPDVRELVDGNICRCTGYHPILRAAEEIRQLKKMQDTRDTVEWLVNNQWLPAYFTKIPGRLQSMLQQEEPEVRGCFPAGGGTDIMVQKPLDVSLNGIRHFPWRAEMSDIGLQDGMIRIGASVSASEIAASDCVLDYFPEFKDYFRLISSTQVRNMGTLGGNLANASPIADLAILFLALDAHATLGTVEGISRVVALRRFYLGYKTPDLQEEEFIVSVGFPPPREGDFFHFEKVSKREHLDIASVNSAMMLRMQGDIIAKAGLSAGGVAPVPAFLEATCRFLEGKPVRAEVLEQANGVMQGEIAPISDIRGSATYKRMLLRQLFYAHFLKFFPERSDLSGMIRNLRNHG